MTRRQKIMAPWDRWRAYIADGGKGSWPRDEFEALIDWYEDEFKIVMLTLGMRICSI